MAPRPLRRLLGNTYVLAKMRGQRSVPFAPRHYIERVRDARVRRMARYAAATVPFYRDAFRKLNLDPREIRTADDLERLPLVEKDDLRRDPDAFVSTSREGRRSIRFETSGTTGSRVRIQHDRRSMLANIAFGERERQVIVRLLGRETGYREARIINRGGAIEANDAFYRDHTWIPVRPDRIEIPIADPLAAKVEAVNRFRPDILLSYASYLGALARAVAAGTITLHKPKLVIYGSEGMSRAMRLEVEEALGAPVISRYCAVEAFKMAYLCEHRTGFHVHEDLAHLRILASDGTTARDGEPGCVVLSNLVNRGTVLLNYRMTDISNWSSEPCACGRNFRMLAEVDGRIEDLLHLPNGEVLHPRAVGVVIKVHREVLQYQLVQRESGRFLLKLITVGDEAYRRLAPLLVRDMEARLGAGTSVETESCTELPREAGGKVRMVVALKP